MSGEWFSQTLGVPHSVVSGPILHNPLSSLPSPQRTFEFLFFRAFGVPHCSPWSRSGLIGTRTTKYRFQNCPSFQNKSKQFVYFKCSHFYLVGNCLFFRNYHFSDRSHFYNIWDMIIRLQYSLFNWLNCVVFNVIAIRLFVCLLSQKCPVPFFISRYAKLR